MPVSLVTGVAGFMGSHIADHLLRMGHTVVGIDDLSGGFKENIPKGVSTHYISICDPRVVGIFDHEPPDYVFHLAAYAAEGLSHFIKRFNYENNLIGSVNLINAAVNYNVKCFVFTSSIAVYGSAPCPMLETYDLKPEDSYGIAKAAVERELKITNDIFGLPYIIFRPHNVYGTRQNIGDKYRNVVGIFMNQLLKAEPMTIFGDGFQRRSFTNIWDIAPIIAQSVTLPKLYGQTFNIGCDESFTVKDLAFHVAQAMDVKCRIKHLPARNEVKNAVADHGKLKRYIGSFQKTSLTVGLRQMAEWVKQHGARESKEFENIEIEKNLPLSWRKDEENTSNSKPVRDC
jgi:UDP-glucose 4-epimerase